MLTSSRIKAVACLCAGLGLLTPQLQAGQTAPRKAKQSAAPKITDVVLDQSSLHGHLLDGQGQTLDGATIELIQGDNVVAQTTTDGAGRYQVDGLKGGLYLVRAGGQTVVIRCWTEESAPPNARQQLTQVAHGSVVRGGDEASANLSAGSDDSGGVVATAAVVGGVGAGTTAVVMNSNTQKSIHKLKKVTP